MSCRAPACLASMALACLLAACSGSPSAGSSIAGSAASPTPSGIAVGPADASPAAAGGGAGACGGADAATAVRSALANELAASSFRETIESRDASSKTTHVVVEYQAPDRIHTRVILASGKTIETVQVGKQAWNNVGSGWQPGIAVDLKTIFATAGGLSADTTFSAISVAGQETIDGAAATDYAYTGVISTNGTSVSSTGTMSIRQADCLPLKVVETGTTGGVATSATIVIGDYGQVSVQPPA